MKRVRANRLKSQQLLMIKTNILNQNMILMNFLEFQRKMKTKLTTQLFSENLLKRLKLRKVDG